jgi:RNA polymerase sigma-70 factor (ECF subfamily)
VINAPALDERRLLAQRFEGHRPRLRAVAYRMLGSISEADDAVQEAWLRLDRTDASTIKDLEGWLITVVARVCLDALRARRSRHELSVRVPEPLVSPDGETDPEHAAILGDALGLALLVVLDELAPAERLAFVLHDVFGVQFDQIAPMVDRSTAATRQLASRVRRRVRGAPVPDADLERQRAVVDAFFAAARACDLKALLAVLDPDVVVRADFGALPGGSREVRGARAVAEQTLDFTQFTRYARPALVNGAVGVIGAEPGRPYSVVGFTVRLDKIVEIDILADPARLRHLDLAGLDEPSGPAVGDE